MSSEYPAGHAIVGAAVDGPAGDGEITVGDGGEDGAEVNAVVGAYVGSGLGAFVGPDRGASVGSGEGASDGSAEGATVGTDEGSVDLAGGPDVQYSESTPPEPAHVARLKE